LSTKLSRRFEGHSPDRANRTFSRIVFSLLGHRTLQLNSKIWTELSLQISLCTPRNRESIAHPFRACLCAVISPSALISTKYEIILPLCDLLYPRASPLIFVRSTSSSKGIRRALLHLLGWPIEAGHFTVIALGISRIILG
jgi:hypothetical protein